MDVSGEHEMKPDVNSESMKTRNSKTGGTTKLSHIRKKRTGFTIAKDLQLLKVAVQKNPWQLGDTVWKEIADEMNTLDGFDVTPRTVRNRIDLLLSKLSKEQLTSKTGTEEEQSQRGELLQEILTLVEESKSSINNFSDPADIGSDVEEKTPENDVTASTSEDVPSSSKKARREEIAAANKERFNSRWTWPRTDTYPKEEKQA